jgi:TonB family protein
MSIPTKLWRDWENRVIDGAFPLLRWLGGSDHSAVFLTQRGGSEAHKTVVKLLSSENLDEEAQLFLWADSAKLSHPHLIQLFECGRCELDETRLLYVVMEYADESLAEVIPLRPLEPDEISEMLAPTAQALDFLHKAGRVHGSVRPSNVMAVDDQLKLSTDGVRKIGTLGTLRGPSAYQPSEALSEGLYPSADIWSLGATLVAAFTQHGPEVRNDRGDIVVPETLPEPFREIVRQCLQTDPRQRCTTSDILRRLHGNAPSDSTAVEVTAPKSHSGRWIAVVIVAAALLLLALAGSRLVSHSKVPAAETTPPQPPPSRAETAPTQSPAPFSQKQNQATGGNARGSVLQQIMPEVSRGAQSTITGKVKVTVRVAVDPSGKVSQATLTSPGPSRYFANRALDAARRWKFNPPQAEGQPEASEWLLRFQFGRGSTQVYPTEVRP